jgi:hypothetical protein
MKGFGTVHQACISDESVGGEHLAIGVAKLQDLQNDGQ